jgi:hypothetical protein
MATAMTMAMDDDGDEMNKTRNGMKDCGSGRSESTGLIQVHVFRRPCVNGKTTPTGPW